MANYRRIYEEYYGVKIPKGYHVHHIDFNHNNDDPLNLEALDKDVHAQKHGFLSNFIMAQVKANQLGAAAHKTPEFREKMSKIVMGRKHTDEHRRKNSEAKMRNHSALGSKKTEEWKLEKSKLMCGNTNALGPHKKWKLP